MSLRQAIGFFAGAGYCDEAVAFFARMTGTPSAAVKNLINQLFLDYISCGYWNLSDVIVRFNIFDAQAGLLNLKTNAINATNVNSCVFTKYYGYEGDASTKYINSNYKPSLHGINFTLNNAHFYKDVDIIDPITNIKFDGGGNGIYGLVYIGDNNATYLGLQRMNSTEGANSGIIRVGSNFLSRQNSTQMENWSETVKTTIASTSTTLTDGLIYLFAMTWNPDDGPRYLNAQRLRGYSLGGYCNDTIKVAVKTANDYFNTNIIGLIP